MLPDNEKEMWDSFLAFSFQSQEEQREGRFRQKASWDQEDPDLNLSSVTILWPRTPEAATYLLACSCICRKTSSYHIYLSSGWRAEDAALKCYLCKVCIQGHFEGILFLSIRCINRHIAIKMYSCWNPESLYQVNKWSWSDSEEGTRLHSLIWPLTGCVPWSKSPTLSLLYGLSVKGLH